MEHILVVDDEAIIRTTLERILAEEGYQVTSVSTGTDALAHLAHNEVGLILLDLNLPDTHGIEVLRQVKEIDPELLVIVVTGYASVESAVEALKLGAYDYIKKPFKAATNIDPLVAIRERRFREDLYYRLNVFPIQVPPLRERPEDTGALARLFLLEFAGQFHKDFKDIDPDARNLLQRYRWPGNVRELRNVMERICIMHNDGLLRPAHLPGEIVSFEAGVSGIDLPEDVLDIEAVVDRVTRQLIGRALVRTGGNTARAARLLGLPRGTLRYKMKKYRMAE